MTCSIVGILVSLWTEGDGRYFSVEARGRMAIDRAWHSEAEEEITVEDCESIIDGFVDSIE